MFLSNNLLNKKKLIKILLLVIVIVTIFLFAPVLSQRESLKEDTGNINLDDKSQMVDSAIDTQLAEEKVLSEEKEQVEGSKVKRANVRFGVVVQDYSNRSGEISGLENILGVTVSTVGIYKQFGLPTNQYLIEDDLAYIKKAGKILLIAWEPWNPDEGMNQSTDYLKEIQEGKYDTYITSFASQVKNFSSPVILRFAHEMNGSWYPWGNRPSEYISAYQRIIDTFRREGVTNVKFMWSINHESVPYEAIEQSRKYFPGDGYVDIIGLDGLNYGTSGAGSIWRSFSQIFSPSYNFVSKYYPNMPIIVSEVASTELGGNKSTWINDMFLGLSTMPKIEEIVWFNLLKETDWRIDSSPSSKESFKNNL